MCVCMCVREKRETVGNCTSNMPCLYQQPTTHTSVLLKCGCVLAILRSVRYMYLICKYAMQMCLSHTHTHTHTHTNTHTHTHHVDGLWVNSLCDDPSLVRDVLHELIQGSSLHLLVLEVAQWVEVEIKDDTTLL